MAGSRGHSAAVLRFGGAGPRSIVEQPQPKPSTERASQCIHADKSTSCGNSLERQVGVLQQPLGHFDPSRLNKTGGRHPAFIAKNTREVSLAHTGAPS